MDTSSVLWTNWHEQLKDLLTGIYGHQKKTLAFLCWASARSGSAVMQRVAETLSERGLSESKMSNIERRLARFIGNSRIVVPLIWKLFLAQVLAPFRGQNLSFVLDNTPFRDDLTIVYLGLLVHSRVLPVAWAVMPAQTTWDEGQWEIVGRLLDQVCVHLPDTCCTLMADRGLAGMPLVKLCTSRGWHYLLRVRAEHTCRRFFNGKLERTWKRFDQIVRHRLAIAGMGKPGCGKKKHWIRTSVSCGIKPVRSHGCSSAIREQDADKSRYMPGACEWKQPSRIVKAAASISCASWIVDRTHLDRLLLALFLAMWWTSHLAAACTHHGQRQRGCLAWTAATRVSFGWDGSGS